MILFFVEALIFIISFFYIKRNIKINFLFCFAIILYFIYIFIGPLDAYIHNKYEKMGGYFGGHFYEGLLIYTIALFTFSTTYILSSLLIKQTNKKLKVQYSLRNNYLYIFLVIFIIVSITLYVYSKNTYFLSETNTITNYLLFFSDSLILIFVILFYEKKNNPLIIVLLVISVFYFLLLGFRYRILFLIIAYFFNMLTANNQSIKRKIQIIIGVIAAILIINNISTNRYIIKNQDFKNISFTLDNPLKSSTATYFLAQTNNYSTDFNVLRYMEDNNIDHDYAFSMFTHIFIRLTPASLYTNNKKPAIPQQEIIINCFGSKEGYYSGSAVTNIFEYYIAFGVFGVIFFMSLLGFILAYISKKTDLLSNRDRVIIIMCAMLVFQEITRGYMPQVVTNFVYLYIALRLMYKKYILKKDEII